jgi:hypothetical protein
MRPKRKDNKFLRNVYIRSYNYTVSQPIRPQSEPSPPWKLWNVYTDIFSSVCLHPVGLKNCCHLVKLWVQLNSEWHNWYLDCSRTSTSELRHSNGMRARTAAMIRTHYQEARRGPRFVLEHRLLFFSGCRGGSWRVGVRGPCIISKESHEFMLPAYF